MFKPLEVQGKVLAVLQSVVTVAAAVSQGAAELVKVLGSWDGQWVNLAALVPAVLFAIRRVTPVAKVERGLS